MRSQFRTAIGLITSLTLSVSIFMAPFQVSAAEILVDQQITLNANDAPNTYTEVSEILQVKHGRVAVQESVYEQDTQVLAGKREAEFAKFNEWVSKYPFVNEFPGGLTNEGFKSFMAKVEELPEPEKTDLMKFVDEVLWDRQPKIPHGKKIKKQIRIWSVSNPDESEVIHIAEDAGSLQLGPTGVAWEERRKHPPLPQKYNYRFQKIIHYWDFATKKHTTYEFPLSKDGREVDVRIYPEYYSVRLLVDRESYKWDLKKNKLVKYSTLVKLPVGYDANKVPVVEGSHYIGWYLAASKTNSLARMVWLDTKTNKTHTLTIPKDLPYGFGRVYGEFAYSTHYDKNTGRLKIWQYGFANKKINLALDQVLVDKPQSIEFKVLENREVVFETIKVVNERSGFSANGSTGLAIINLDSKLVSRYEFPYRAQIKDGILSMPQAAFPSEPATHYWYGYTQSKLIFMNLKPEMSAYLNLLALSWGAPEGYVYLYDARELLLSKWAFYSASRYMGDMVAIPISK